MTDSELVAHVLPTTWLAVLCQVLAAGNRVLILSLADFAPASTRELGASMPRADGSVRYNTLTSEALADRERTAGDPAGIVRT